MGVKKLMFVLMLILVSLSAKAQMHIGTYYNGFWPQIGIGTDNEKKNFGELRLVAPDRVFRNFGAEGIFNRNFHQSDWYNIHGGIMVGYDGNASIGIPLGLTFKPISSFRGFGIFMEGTPFYYVDDVYLRASLGLRLRLGGD